MMNVVKNVLFSSSSRRDVLSLPLCRDQYVIAEMTGEKNNSIVTSEAVTAKSRQEMRK